MSLQGSTRLDTPAQHAQQPLAEPSFESLFCQESSLSLPSTSDEELGGSQPASSLSQQPTEQDIQYMDEVDFTDNLGSLLGPGDSWIMPEGAHFATLQAETASGPISVEGMSNEAQMLKAKPFQELFPVSA